MANHVRLVSSLSAAEKRHFYQQVTFAETSLHRRLNDGQKCHIAECAKLGQRATVDRLRQLGDLANRARAS